MSSDLGFCDEWNAMAGTLEQARQAVWGTAPWDAGVAMCLDRITPTLDDVGRAGGRILDLGCGMGRLLLPLADRWPDATMVGLDASSAMLAWAEVQAGDRQNVRLRRGSWRQLHHVGALDAAYSVLTFQHLDRQDQQEYIGALARQLRPGAQLVLQFVPYGDEGPLNHPVPPSTMTTWCEAAGFDVLDVETPPERETWLWLTARRRATSEADHA